MACCECSLVSPVHQLMVIWQAGRHRECGVLEVLAADDALEIVGTVEVNWPTQHFPAALSQLYGTHLPSRSEKIRHCGNGPFLVVLLRDLDPRPGLRRTPRGVESVDTHMFDLKQVARRLTGGGHRVHATDNAAEFRRDLVILTGMTEAEFVERGTFGRETRSVAPDGADGWSTVAAMLEALSRRTRFCVLRNFEGWDRLGPTDDHPDIDLLVASPDEAANAITAHRTSRRRGRVQHQVQIGGRKVNVDIRTPGDGYLPATLAEQTLADAVADPQAVSIPSARHHLETLLYHALVHRSALSQEYALRINRLADAVGEDLGDLYDPAVQRKLVHAIDVEPPLPDDPSVKYNDALFGMARGLRQRRNIQRVRSFGAKGLRRAFLVS